MSRDSKRLRNLPKVTQSIKGAGRFKQSLSDSHCFFSGVYIRPLKVCAWVALLHFAAFAITKAHIEMRLPLPRLQRNQDLQLTTSEGKK